MGQWEAGKFEVGPLGGWLVYEGLFFALQWLVIGIAVALVYQRVASRSAAASVSLAPPIQPSTWSGDRAPRSARCRVASRSWFP